MARARRCYGPLVFVVAVVLTAAARPEYHHAKQAISELGEMGAPPGGSDRSSLPACNSSGKRYSHGRADASRAGGGVIASRALHACQA
jgi:hypothetical protein